MVTSAPPLQVVPGGIPDDLKRLPQWVAWIFRPKPGRKKPEKVPVDPGNGKPLQWRDARTWVGFDDAMGFYRDSGLSGIGFVFTPADPFAGVDLDDVVDPDTGAVDPAASVILDRLGTYSEISVSGTGAKAVGIGRLDPDGPHRARQIELYDDARFFALTGHRLPTAPAEIRPFGEPLRALQDQLRPPNGAEDVGIASEERTGGFLGSDDDLLRVALNAKNGGTISRYWAGDYNGHPTASEALLGLAQLLAFWTGPDHERLERLLLRSELWRRSEAEREKWDSRRGRSDTWGSRYVIAKAIDTCRSFYAGGLWRTSLRALRSTARSARSEQPPPSGEQETCVGHGVHFAEGTIPPELLRDPLTAAWRKVLDDDLPQEVDLITGRRRTTVVLQRQLLGLCWHLAKAGKGRFFLAEEDAARLLGVNRATVNRWLKRFRTKPYRFLWRESTGNSYAGKASEYRWVPPLVHFEHAGPTGDEH